MLLRLALVPVAAVALAVAGCTSSLTNGTQSNVNGGSVFVVGTDAPPLAAVVGFPVTDRRASPRTLQRRHSRVPIISCTTGVTADFARFNGLQTVLDDSNVPAGYVRQHHHHPGHRHHRLPDVPTPGSAPPTIATMAATYQSIKLGYHNAGQPAGGSACAAANQ